MLVSDMFYSTPCSCKCIFIFVRIGIGETGASCYGGRLLQGHFMQNYYNDGEIADSSFILIHQGNH